MSTGILFPSQAKTAFTVLTKRKYEDMAKRDVLPLPFTMAQFRDHVLEALGWHHDGAIRCRYCGAHYTLEEVAADHAIPLSRGGSSDLNNLELVCMADNSRKGSMRPEEYDKLVHFLEREIPFARMDVLLRLQMHSKLIAGKRQAEMLARNGGNFPKPKKPEKPPLIVAIEERF
jgi:HNH endonuclease